MNPWLSRFAVIAVALPACRPSPLVTAPVTTSASTPAQGYAGRGRAIEDADITTALLNALKDDSALSGAVVRVTTWKGIVELSGTAPSLLARERATRHAEILRGVRSVVDRIAVEHAAIEDGALTRDIGEALERDPATRDAQLGVAVQHGVVTIRGATRSIAGKHLATTVVSGVRGVQEIRNEIDVVGGPPRSDAAIAAEVSSRLRWDVFVDDGGLVVRSRAGVVELEGAVASAAEKRRAVTDAWVGGVTDVEAAGLHVDPWLRPGDPRRDDGASPPADAVERAVRDALVVDPRINVLRVHVAVSRGLATLRGTVPTLAARAAAAQVARDTVGVHAVANLLAVSAAGAPSDSEIERRVSAALAVDPYTEGRGVVARVVEGTVTLSGGVGSIFEKAEAESVAANVSGVRAVENALAVRDASRAHTTNRYLVPYGRSATIAIAAPIAPAKPDSTIHSELVRRLAITPFVDPHTIEARIHAGRVVLTGTVPTWRAWLAASDAAWHAGASGVENRLLIR